MLSLKVAVPQLKTIETFFCIFSEYLHGFDFYFKTFSPTEVYFMIW